MVIAEETIKTLKILNGNLKFKAKDISDAIKVNGFETIKDWLYKSIGLNTNEKRIEQESKECH